MEKEKTNIIQEWNKKPEKLLFSRQQSVVSILSKSSSTPQFISVFIKNSRFLQNGQEKNYGF